MHLIHCGSSVTVSPGVTIDLVDSLGRFAGCSISISPCESAESASEESSYWMGTGGAGAVIENGIVNAAMAKRVSQ